MRSANLGYPVLLGNWEAFEELGVVSLPTLILVDRQGIVRYRHVGAGRPSKRAELEDALVYLLEEEDEDFSATDARP